MTATTRISALILSPVPPTHGCSRRDPHAPGAGSSLGTGQRAAQGRVLSRAGRGGEGGRCPASAPEPPPSILSASDSTCDLTLSMKWSMRSPRTFTVRGSRDESKNKSALGRSSRGESVRADASGLRGPPRLLQHKPTPWGPRTSQAALLGHLRSHPHHPGSRDTPCHPASVTLQAKARRLLGPAPLPYSARVREAPRRPQRGPQGITPEKQPPALPGQRS